MIALGICVLALVVSYWAGKQSLGRGLVVVLVFGYFYGILRANLLTAYSHFIFDASLVGVYLSQFLRPSEPKIARRLAILRLWMIVLIAWPMLVVFLPFQAFLVSLIGLRGCAFFIPVLLLGGRLATKDLIDVSRAMAVLNVIAFGFAMGEYVLGLERFYPISPVTFIIYSSGDVAGSFFRIPAIFVNAHAYGGTMVNTLPFVIGLWEHSERRWMGLLALVGTAAALAGVLMCAARLSFIMATGMVVAALLTNRATKSSRLIFIVLLAVGAWSGFNNERLGRFRSLSDTDYVSDRIAGSVNRGFWEILVEHPMGNGLGGGGTSIPYFLQGQVRNPIGMENGYALILCEQGIIGLVLWLAFIGWFLSRAPTAFAKGLWANSRRMAWCLGTLSLGTAWIGTGLLTSIPSTVLLFLAIGWTSIPTQREYGPARPEKPNRIRAYRPAYTQSAI